MMGLFDKFKKEKTVNETHRERSIADLRVPTAFSPINRPDFPDVIVSDGVKFEKAYYYNDIPARLFGSLPSSPGHFDFSSDGKYLCFDGKRIASVSKRSDMIHDFLSRRDIVSVEPCAQADSELRLAAAFYKKLSSDDVDPQIIEYSVEISSADSYFSCDELRGLKIDDMSLDPESLSFGLYSSGRFVAPLSDAKTERVAALNHDGYVFSGGSVVDFSETNSGLSYVLRIRLSFI